MRYTDTAAPSDGRALLDRILHEVARRRLRPEHSDDFVQFAWLKLLERRYDVFERFDGRSTLRTYLTVVALRLLLDWRNAQLGKWRPSAAARRLGEVAIRFERLVCRDGYTVDEAIETLRRRGDGPSMADLERVTALLPLKPRPVFVPLDAVESAGVVGTEDAMAAADARRETATLRRSLIGAISQLGAEERRLIWSRYVEGTSVQALARTAGIEPKRLYRRFDQILGTLRVSLSDGGVLRVASTGGHTRRMRMS